MKKLTLLTAIGLASCLSSFGQGFLIFNNSSSTAVKDNFTFGHQTNSPATVMVAILWHAGPGSILPALGTASTASNTLPSWGSLAGVNALGWNWAMNSGTSNLLSALTRSPIPTTGTYSGGTVGILGTNPNDTISMYVVGWHAGFADPTAAAAANAGLGWSNPINELLGASSSPGVTMAAGGVTSFAVNPVPEPATFALAGLGAAAMLIFRRRNRN
jgi:hypothetical protein